MLYTIKIFLFSALNVIQVRAKAMHEASLETPSGMMTVF